jgi:hypothetical protein
MDFDTLVETAWLRWHDLTLERYGNMATLPQMYEVAQDVSRAVANEAGLPPLTITLYGELKGVLARLTLVDEVAVQRGCRPTTLH